MDEFLKELRADLITRGIQANAEATPEILDVLGHLNPEWPEYPNVTSVGEAIGYWHMGVRLIEGTEPHDPWKITPNGEIVEYIPE